jgi:hypothetical protein
MTTLSSATTPLTRRDIEARNVLLPANGGTFALRFKHPGTFPFYCRFHSMLDKDNQPIAPGPDGGIQDQNGNFGTPMSGVITVVEDN